MSRRVASLVTTTLALGIGLVAPGVARAGEGHGEKKQKRVRFPEVFAQLDLLRPVRGFAGE